MSVDLTHPAVTGFLDEVAAEAARAGLPPGRRAELDAELRSHLVEAVGPAPDDLSVRTALDRLGSAAEIVAAESGPGPSAQVSAAPGSVALPGQAGQPGQPGPWSPRPASAWGVGEVLAVLGLTVGTFVLPVVGPLVGLVLAWASPRWTRAEKVVATVLSVGPLIVLGVLVTFYVRMGAS